MGAPECGGPLIEGGTSELKYMGGSPGGCPPGEGGAWHPGCMGGPRGGRPLVEGGTSELSYMGGPCGGCPVGEEGT